jgi:hypothetical protein
MSKRVYFGSVALYVLTLAFLLTDRLVWQPAVTEANVRRIRPGMTRAEVEAILGQPCDSDLGGPGNGPSVCWIWIAGNDAAVIRVRNDWVTAAEWVHAPGLVRYLP